MQFNMLVILVLILDVSGIDGEEFLAVNHPPSTCVRY